MPVVLKHTVHDAFDHRKNSTPSEAKRGALIFVGVFLVIGMAFLYGLASLMQTPHASGTVPDELLSLARRADIADQGY